MGIEDDLSHGLSSGAEPSGRGIASSLRASLAHPRQRVIRRSGHISIVRHHLATQPRIPIPRQITMVAPSTQPATTVPDAPKPQSARHVPGAGDLLSKRPKKKKPAADASKASGTKTTGETPVALLAKAPNAADLPAELRGEQGDIERELKEDAAAVAAAGGHEKGAVGEAVSRRMKVLTKKIVRPFSLCDPAGSPFPLYNPSDAYTDCNFPPAPQQRFRAYTEKPESALNPDQKAAIATLPALEGGLRELEDIAKAVETIEHEHRLASRDELEAAKLEAVEVYKVCHSALHVLVPCAETSFE